MERQKEKNPSYFGYILLARQYRGFNQEPFGQIFPTARPTGQGKVYLPVTKGGVLCTTIQSTEAIK